ncbi:MAG TPA: hypothetical protein VJU58_03990 [Microbacterium sp.]|nr:hypothetical protein [Microbacterium sp.]
MADIVARRGPELTIVETKASLSLALLHQAMERRRQAHRVYIAAPYTRHLGETAAICAAIGIGLLDVRVAREHVCSSDGFGMPAVHEVVTSARWNTRPVALRAKLSDGHKTHARAGTKGGGRWTPFRDTCEQLARVVRTTPGITLKAAVDEIKHHYRTPAIARGSIAHWIHHGKVPGVRLDLESGDQPTLVPA